MISDIEEKYEALAVARREKVALTKKKFSEKQINSLPKKYPRQIHKLMDGSIQESFVRDGLGFVVTDGGYLLASEVGIPYHHRIFEALRDKLPPALEPETFLAGLNAAQRFDSVSWLPPNIRNSSNKMTSVIEIGSFLGHKAVRCGVDYMKADGIYHAIELMDDNYEILRANINANGLQNIIKPHNIAISDVDGEIEIYSKGRQRSGIVPISNVGVESASIKKAMKLSSFYQCQKLDVVDFCYITVNGAELKVLEGAGGALDSIKFIRIVSKYDVDGERIAPKCCEFLKDNGFIVDFFRDTIDAKNPERGE